MWYEVGVSWWGVAACSAVASFTPESLLNSCDDILKSFCIVHVYTCGGLCTAGDVKCIAAVAVC